MSISDSLIAELEGEAIATRALLELVPEDKLEWRPHSKSMSLGQLALHVAGIPGAVAKLAQVDTADPLQVDEIPSPDSAADLVPALQESVAQAKEILSGTDDTMMDVTWRMMDGDREIIAMRRISLLRSIMLNHWYHHRGQLTVYLRLLEIPLPSVYGPTADVNPFS